MIEIAWISITITVQCSSNHIISSIPKSSEDFHRQKQTGVKNNVSSTFKINKQVAEHIQPINFVFLVGKKISLGYILVLIHRN